MKTTLSFILASLVIVAGQASAEEQAPRHPRDPRINARQQHQQQRIKQGVKSGQLNREEAKQLRHEEKAVRQEERAYKSDGTLSKEERKDLHQDLNNLSKDIYQEKHDGEVRPKAVK